MLLSLLLMTGAAGETPSTYYVPQSFEGKMIDAAGIVASLSAGPGSPIEVKSSSRQVGSIRSGQNALAPVKFDKVDKSRLPFEK